MEGLMNDYHDEDISNVCAHAAADMRDFLSRCAATLLAASPGKTAIFCGGEALLAESGSLQAAGTIAAMIDGELIIENAFSRLDRGGDLPHPKRLPYFPNDAAKALAAFDVIVTVGARRPVAMFGYDGAGPSHLLRLSSIRIGWVTRHLQPASSTKPVQNVVEVSFGCAHVVVTSTYAVCKRKHLRYLLV